MFKRGATQENVSLHLGICGHCAKQAYCVGKIGNKGEKEVQTWCADCLLHAWQDHHHVLVIHHFSCTRCSAKAVLSYHITWGENDHFLCEQCMIEIELDQRKNKHGIAVA